VTLVVLHTAVLAYVAELAERRVFAERAMSHCSYWISNEAPHVFSEISSRFEMADTPGRFLLSVNSTPVAWADPHGAALEWIGAEGWMVNS